MSTRAQIAIQIGPDEWAQIYVHYDGYPEHMLPALAPLDARGHPRGKGIPSGAGRGDRSV